MGIGLQQRSSAPQAKEPSVTQESFGPAFTAAENATDSNLEIVP